MVECTITEDLGRTWVNVKGRIDSMTSPRIERQIHEIVLGGERTIVANLQEVNYISSAGLRVFLSAQKQLKKVGGEVILYGLAGYGLEVFKQGSLLRFFRMISSREEMGSAFETAGFAHSLASRAYEGISFQCLEREAHPGSLLKIGALEKLPSADYTEADVVTVRAGQMRSGTGLAALGEKYEDYKNLFGEAVLIDGNFFFYPAVKRPAVDFMLSADQEPDFAYKFLHGFGFGGEYRYIAAFGSTEGFIRLDRLVRALFSISDADVLGIVFLAESKGLWGMHLKQVPTWENKPGNGKEIFHADNFPDWVNFPVEPGEINHIVAGAGIAVRDRDSASHDIQACIPRGNNCHMHGAVFSREPLSKTATQFEEELGRVLTELDVFKVQHLLGQSLLGSGMAGIIEIKE